MVFCVCSYINSWQWVVYVGGYSVCNLSYSELKFCKTKPIAVALSEALRIPAAGETCGLGRLIFFVIFLRPTPWRRLGSVALFELGDQLECATVYWQ
jgi:hypothetical protein